jgi:hypothetical protein
VKLMAILVQILKKILKIWELRMNNFKFWKFL